MKYALFVDEYGQSGIKKVRTNESGGASRYMTLGAALVLDAKKSEVSRLLADLQAEFSKQELHCSKLNHNQICRFAQELAKQKVLLFGVISLKETLGGYRKDIEASDKAYYNKCSQYLLERVGLFIESNGGSEDDFSVCFEVGGFDYPRLRGLIRKCREKPLRSATKLLKHVNPEGIRSAPKASEPMLQLADLVAHALFRCVDDGPSTFGVKETRYVHELRNRFYCDSGTGKVIGSGIYAVHKLLDIKAEKQVDDFLEDLVAKR